MKVSQKEIDAINRSGVLNTPGAVPQTILDVWRIEWTGPCVDPGCRVRDHHFVLALAVHQAHRLEPMPTGKIAVVIDGAIGNVPMTKNTIAELIEDLRQMLDVMP